MLLFLFLGFDSGLVLLFVLLVLFTDVVLFLFKDLNSITTDLSSSKVQLVISAAVSPFFDIKKSINF